MSTTWHIGTPTGPLCGNKSFGAISRVADCERCQKRLDEILKVLLEVADENDKVKKLVDKLGIRPPEAATDT